MIFEHTDYRSFLKTILSEKAKDRSGYSLRAFSEKLGISNSFLSEVLSAKKSLSMELAFKISVKLDLTDAETQYLCLLVQLEQEKDPVFREELSNRLSILNPSRETHDLSVDLFKVIGDWHHYAILQLTFISGFKLSASSAAKALDISPVEAELAIERLERVELLKKSASGEYQTKHSSILAESRIPNSALKNFHKQVLEKAILSLQTQTPAERMSATDVFPIDSKYLPKLDRLSREFSAQVLNLSRRSKTRDDVYALGVHFFRLSEKRV